MVDCFIASKAIILLKYTVNAYSLLKMETALMDQAHFQMKQAKLSSSLKMATKLTQES